jgi:hypothetical protein
MSGRISAHIRNNLVGYVAVYIALGGAAWAVTVAPKNSVVSKSIKNGQVKTSDLADGGVTGTKLAAGAVDGGKLAAGAVDAAKVQGDSLTGAQIAESTLTGVDAALLGGQSVTAFQARVTGTCTTGQAIRAIDANGNATCESTGGPPNGPAGGDLTGTYPDPTIAAGAVTGGAGGNILDNSITGADVNEPSLAAGGVGAGVMSGRVNGAPPSPAYGSPVGTSTANATRANVASLSPAVPTIARDLSVKLTAAPGAGEIRQVTLTVNGADTALVCAIFDASTTCVAGASAVPVPAGAELAMSVGGSAGAATADVMFGFRLTP